MALSHTLRAGGGAGGGAAVVAAGGGRKASSFASKASIDVGAPAPAVSMPGSSTTWVGVGGMRGWRDYEYTPQGLWFVRLQACIDERTSRMISLCPLPIDTKLDYSCLSLLSHTVSLAHTLMVAQQAQDLCPAAAATTTAAEQAAEQAATASFCGRSLTSRSRCLGCLAGCRRFELIQLPL